MSNSISNWKINKSNGGDVEAHQLTAHDKAVLNSYPVLRNCDRKFVRMILQMLYKNNEKELRNLALEKTKKF